MKHKKNNKKVILYTIIMVLLSIGLGFSIKPIFEQLNFGLDLQGGFEILYQVKSVDGEKVTKDMVTNTYKTVERRIDSLGVTEPSIVVEGTDKIRIQIAGVTDPDEARSMLKQAANLTFRDTSDNLLMNASVLRSGGAKLSTDTSGRPAVALSVKDKDEFFDVTKKLSQADDNRIVIWLDYEDGDSFQTEQYMCGTENSNCLSVATVSQGFASDVIIQGNFTEEEASNLVDLINSGSLPTKLEEISSKTVGAQFGDQSLNMTFTAGVIAVILIMALMIFLYRFAGLVSSFGLLFYTVLTFGVYWLIGGVLTLPGIAAIVIGIGMAVDANVITYSRIRDELYKGTELDMAFKLGNKESFWTIFDSNFTTLIVAVILFIFGESSVKGFATLLIISIFVTMFVMVFILRHVLHLFVNTGWFQDKPRLFVGAKRKWIPDRKKKEKPIYKPFAKLDFAYNRKVFYVISIVLVVAGVLSLATQGLQLGIDFKGGSSITVTGEKEITEKDFHRDLKELGYEVENVDELTGGAMSARVVDTLSQSEIKETESYFNEKYEATTEIGVVSDVVKQELIKNAVLSLLLASIAIVLYISMRFTFTYAVGAIVALLHDVFMMIGLFSIFRLEVNSMFIAAMLSIVGYSINDTIVTFDRIRENIDKKYHGNLKKKEQYMEVVNESLRETFGRSLVTTFTTLIPVVILIFLGSHEILNFNIALMFGLISGVYSSLFIASQLWLDLDYRRNHKKKKTPKKPKKKEDEEILIKGINA